MTNEDHVRHLSPHEIAHIVNNWPQDKKDDCDQWAFSKMGIT